jgi:hypothetical protein
LLVSGDSREGCGVVGASVGSGPNVATGEGSRLCVIGDEVVIGETVGLPTRLVTM